MRSAAQRVVQTISRECLAVRMRALNRALTAIYDGQLRPHGLTVAQLNLLVVIGRLERVDPTRIGRILAMEKSTVSRNLKRMEENGWIRIALAEKGHKNEIETTPRGEALLVAADAAWRKAQAAARTLLGAEHATLLARLPVTPRLTPD